MLAVSWGNVRDDHEDVARDADEDHVPHGLGVDAAALALHEALAAHETRVVGHVEGQEEHGHLGQGQAEDHDGFREIKLVFVVRVLVVDEHVEVDRDEDEGHDHGDRNEEGVDHVCRGLKGDEPSEAEVRWRIRSRVRPQIENWLSVP